MPKEGQSAVFHLPRSSLQGNPLCETGIIFTLWQPTKCGFPLGSLFYLDPPAAPFFCFREKAEICAVSSKKRCSVPKVPSHCSAASLVGESRLLVGRSRLLVGQSRPFTARFGLNISKMQKCSEAQKCASCTKKRFSLKRQKTGTP